jgi:hypothetical protein
MIDGGDKPSGRHLLIAGTGRAGTSFLVRWLSELGMDTQLSRDGDAAAWDENANAGLETVPLDNSEHGLPYVIKFPWLYQCIDHVLATGRPGIDAVIVPVRDLMDAAASRTIVELQAMHEQMPWINQMDQSWEVWGKTPGGIAYSLNPIDQGRILAVGFHHLVQRLIEAEIPVVFLAYPRLVEDWRHPFDRLRPFLPATVDEATAELAHRRLSDPDKKRVETELVGPRRNAPIIQYPDYAQLDFAAMRRELQRASKSVAAAEETKLALQRAEALRDAAWSETNQWREALNGANMRASAAEWEAYGHRVAAEKATEEAATALRLAASAAEEATAARDREANADERAANANERAANANEQTVKANEQTASARQEALALREEVHSLRQEIEHTQREAEQIRAALAVAQAESVKFKGEIAALCNSRSWRLTRPYRDAHLMLNRLLRRGR